MLTCLFFVVAGFVEFAIVLQLHRCNEKEKNIKSLGRANSTNHFERCKSKENGLIIREESKYFDDVQEDASPMTSLKSTKFGLDIVTKNIGRNRRKNKNCKANFGKYTAKNDACHLKFNVQKIDAVAFGIVSVLFILFNVIYWATFIDIFELHT